MIGRKAAFLFPAFLCLALASCPDGQTDKSPANDDLTVKTGRVTFFNESGYTVVVHKDAFSGPVLLELPPNRPPQAVDVRTSDNHGVGTTFSIEYLYPVPEATDAESGTVTASGIDPNVQINRVVEADKSYVIQIPKPKNLEFREAFIKILNGSVLPFELRRLGTAFKQAGNGNLSVPPGKTGIYRIEGIPAGGREIQDYRVVSTFESTAVPAFTARNGVIYSFGFDGTEVKKTGEQSMVFK